MRDEYGDEQRGIEWRPIMGDSPVITVGSTHLWETVWASRGWVVTERAEDWDL